MSVPVCPRCGSQRIDPRRCAACGWTSTYGLEDDSPIPASPVSRAEASLESAQVLEEPPLEPDEDAYATPPRRTRPGSEGPSIGRIVWTVLGLITLVVIISGFVLGRSAAFKEECFAHKVTGQSIGWYKNLVCDTDFNIDN
jgi:hypothetical protein